MGDCNQSPFFKKKYYFMLKVKYYIYIWETNQTQFIMSYLPLIIQLLSGAAGGNLAAKILPKLSLGTAGNSILGILGGGIGGQILNMLGMSPGDGGLDLGSIISSIAGGGVGGGVLMAIIGMIRGAMGGK